MVTSSRDADTALFGDSKTPANAMSLVTEIHTRVERAHPPLHHTGTTHVILFESIIGNNILMICISRYVAKSMLVQKSQIPAKLWVTR